MKPASASAYAVPVSRFGVVLAGSGVVLVVAAAGLLWVSEGAGLFLEATLGALMNCF